MASERNGSGSDDQLPLRWGVILAVGAGAGILAGTLGGTLAGLGAGLAVVGLLSQILGR